MIVVAGEALVDLVPRGEQLQPLPGGSPYNVAVALGRLQTPVAFLGRCSTDGFGRILRDRLEAAGVDLALTHVTDDPTTLALVHLDEQRQASYRFYVEGTSSAGLTAQRLPRLADDDVLHVSLGAVTLRTTPAGDALRHLIEREGARRVVCLDPNVRPRAGGDLSHEARVVEQVLAGCAIVKASEEDLGHLYPEHAVEEVARAWSRAGPALVVVTRGRNGVLAHDDHGRVLRVAASEVDVVDTVGAGDAFTAALLARLRALGRLADREALAATAEDELADALACATRVAGLTCARAGADPPRLDEVEG